MFVWLGEEAPSFKGFTLITVSFNRDKDAVVTFSLVGVCGGGCVVVVVWWCVMLVQ